MANGNEPLCFKQRAIFNFRESGWVKRRQALSSWRKNHLISIGSEEGKWDEVN